MLSPLFPLPLPPSPCASSLTLILLTLTLRGAHRTPKKPKSKKTNILAPSASITAALSTAALPPALAAGGGGGGGTGLGTRETPIALYSDSEEAGARSAPPASTGTLKRKLSETGGAGVSVNALVGGVGNGRGRW